MIVCSCNGISDHEVRACAARTDCRQTPSDVYRSLGHRPNCGICARTIGAILAEMGASAKADAPCGTCPVRAVLEASRARTAPAMRDDPVLIAAE